MAHTDAILVFCAILAVRAAAQASSPAAAPPSSPAAAANASEDAPPKQEVEQAAVRNATKAAVRAAEAASIANKVADHTVNVVRETQFSLDKSRRAVHDARATTEGLSRRQKELLKNAEAKLRDATRRAEYGKLEQAKYLKAVGHLRYSIEEETRLRRLERTLQSSAIRSTNFSGSGNVDMDSMTTEIAVLRKELAEKRRLEAERKVQYIDDQGTNETSDDRSVEQLDADLKSLEAMLRRMKGDGYSASALTRDELKAEIERLREMIRRLEAKQMIPAEYGSLETNLPKREVKAPPQANLKYDIPEKVKMAPLGIRELGGKTPRPATAWWRPASAKVRYLPGGPDWDSVRTGYVAKVRESEKYVVPKAPCDVVRAHTIPPCGAKDGVSFEQARVSAPSGSKFLG